MIAVIKVVVDADGLTDQMLFSGADLEDANNYGRGLVAAQGYESFEVCEFTEAWLRENYGGVALLATFA